MAIQIRRGNKADLQVAELLPGEPVLALDTGEVGIKSAGGDIIWYATLDANGKVKQNPASVGQAGGIMGLPAMLPTTGKMLKMGAGGVPAEAVDNADYLAPYNTTITATSTFSGQTVRVSRAGNIVALTAPALSNYTTPGGYPTYCTLPAGYRPSTNIDIIVPISGTQFANVLITTGGIVNVGIIGASGAGTLRLNFTFVI